MQASRADMRRAIDFSAIRNPNSITFAIVNLLSRRANPMRAKEICRWFHATPAPFVEATLFSMLDSGQIKAASTSFRHRGVLVYWVDKEISHKDTTRYAETMKDYRYAEIAYNAYKSATGGKSLVSGAQLPDFAQLNQAIQDAWWEAARAVSQAE